jgi:effector-binding domain-containing protein
MKAVFNILARLTAGIIPLLLTGFLLPKKVQSETTAIIKAKPRSAYSQDDLTTGNKSLQRNILIRTLFDNAPYTISSLADKAAVEVDTTREPHFTIEEIVVTKKTVVYVTDSANSSEEISKKFMQIIPVELGGFLKKHNLQMAGAPMAWYNTQSMPLVFDVAAPVNQAPATTEGRIKVREVLAGNAVVAHFYGPYHLTPLAYEAVTAWIKQHNKIVNGAPYEVYLGDPGVETDPYKILTDIVFPVK